MKPGLLVLLSLCVFAAAMVPRHRRELEEKEKTICAPNTPCAWTIYKPGSKIVEMKIGNTYCKCSYDTECLIYEDDVTTSAYIHRCRPPTDESES